MTFDDFETAAPSGPMPPPHQRGSFDPRTRPRVVTEEPRLFVNPDCVLTTAYESGLIRGAAIGLAWKNVECPDATALIATDGDIFVGVAANQATEFLAQHADRLLIPTEPGWFLEIHGHAADAWKVAPGQDAPVFAVPFVNLPLLAQALQKRNEYPFQIRVEELAQTMACVRGTGKGETRALQVLLEAGLTACETGLRGRLAGQAAAALWLYRLFLRGIQHRGARRDRALARLARYRAQLPATLREQLYGAVQTVSSTSSVSGETVDICTSAGQFRELNHPSSPIIEKTA